MKLVVKLKIDRMPCQTIHNTFCIDLSGCEVDEVFGAKCYDKHGLYIPHERVVGYPIMNGVQNNSLQIVFPEASWIDDIVDIKISFRSKVHQRRLKLEQIGI